MITYFSGTGNSRFVAQELARETGDKTTDMVRSSGDTTEGRTDVLGIVYPVHAWGIPATVQEYLKSDRFPGKRFAYIYAVCTCGDDVGKNVRLLRHLLERQGCRLQSMWSVQMPNTYVSFPFFDIDSRTVTEEKLKAARERIPQIAQFINRKEKGITDVTPGAMPRLKSYLLRPLFNKFIIGDRWARTRTGCSHCGKCAKVCPLHNITLGADKSPQWNGHCITCLACYHYCPEHCIEFSRFSRGKGQYYFKKRE